MTKRSAEIAFGKCYMTAEEESEEYASDLERCVIKSLKVEIYESRKN